MLNTNTAHQLDCLDYRGATQHNTPLKILILDDSNFDRLRIKREISNIGLNAEIDEISCLCNLQPSLEKKSYDIVVFDYFLPDGTGEDALQVLLKSERNKDADAIMVSGNPWFYGGTVSTMGKSVTLIDKVVLGSGELIRKALSKRWTDY